MDRFESQDEIKWNDGFYQDGSRSRYDGHTIISAPGIERVGKFAHDSWVAGWADADQTILSEGLSKKFPIRKKASFFMDDANKE